LTAGRPRPLPHCVRWGPSSPPSKGQSPPILGPYLLWPNGWMDQDATWYGGGSQPRRLCVRWGPSPYPKRGGAQQFSAFVYYGQTSTWIKMPLGTEVCLGLCNIVLDGDPAPPSLKGHSPPPIFGQCPLWPAKQLDGLRCYLVCR